MHRSEVGRVSFDAIDSDLPVLFFVTARVVLGFENISVLAEQMPPFAETDSNVQNRARLQLPHQVDDNRNGVRTAAGHKREVEAEKSSRMGLREEGCS